MTTNSGTGLIYCNGERNQLYRATIAFTNLKKRRKGHSSLSNVQTDRKTTFIAETVYSRRLIDTLRREVVV